MTAEDTEAREEQKRDLALFILSETRAELIAAASEIAASIAQIRGRVTSPEVLRAMHAEGYTAALDRVDARFMGVVFRTTKNSAYRWRRVGWKPGGSHARPVSIWELR